MDIGTNILRFASTLMDTKIDKFLNVYTPLGTAKGLYIWAWSCASA